MGFVIEVHTVTVLSCILSMLVALPHAPRTPPPVLEARLSQAHGCTSACPGLSWLQNVGLFCFVLFCLVWFGLVWFGLVWFGLVWLGLV